MEEESLGNVTISTEVKATKNLPNVMLQGSVSAMKRSE